MHRPASIWRTFTLLLLPCAAMGGGVLGCAEKRPVRDSFHYASSWKLSGDLEGMQLSAELAPQPVLPDRPAMLSVKIASSDAKKPFQGRVWYRFSYRRGDPLPEEEKLSLTPPIPPEEGVPPHFEEWFDWAELFEPRIENGQAIFTTPVMFPEGKAYVQFRVAASADAPPEELLDWFIYVDKPN